MPTIKAPNMSDHGCPPWVTPHHNGREVLALKTADGLVQGFIHGGRDALCDEPIQVDGSAQKLHEHGEGALG